MPTTPYLSAHTGAEVDAAVLDVPILRGEMDRFTDFTGFTGSAATDLDSIVTTALAVGSRAFVVSGNALYVFVLTAGTDAENSPTVVRPDDFALTTNEKVWKWQAITEAAEITGPGSSVDNGIARWNGTGGTAIQDSPITIDDTGFITVTGATARFLRSTNDGVVSILGGASKTDATFVDFAGDSHATTPGRIGFTTKGVGLFRVANAPLGSLTGTEIFSIGADGSVNVSAKASAQVAAYVVAGADAVPYTVSFDKSRGTVAVPTVITVGDCLGNIRFRGYGGGSGFVTSASIRVDSTGTIADTRVGSSFIIATATNAAPSVLTDTVWVTNQQFVGIGTASPAARLQVTDTNKSAALAYNVFIATSDAMGVDIGGRLALGGRYSTTDTTNVPFGSILGRKENSTDDNGRGYLAFRTTTVAASPFEFEWMRITSDGLVGIGLSDPPVRLAVANGATATAFHLYETVNVGITNYARISLTTTASSNSTIRTEAGGTGFTAGQPRILQVGTGPSSGSNIAGQNAIWHSGQGTGSALGGSHLFQVSAAGSSGIGVNALATAVTIDGAGKLGIGIAPVAKVHVFGQELRLQDNNGFYSFYNAAGTIIGYFQCINGGEAFFTQLQAQSFSLQTNSIRRLVISGAGLVGIGLSTTPGSKLDINNGSTTTDLRLYHTTDGAASPANYSRLTLSHNAAGTGKQTVNFLAETGGTGDDNISIRLAPAGTGGLYLGPVADGTATGGNARGDRSIDLQLMRDAATKVASGLQAVVVGGENNTASGSYSTCCGGTNAIASGISSTCVGGASNTASGEASLATGALAMADKRGQHAHASWFFAARGDGQTSVLCAIRTTTDGTANIELFLDGDVASQRCTIATDTTWGFKISLTARRTDANGESAKYEFSGCIDNNAGTVALVGAVTKTVIAEDTAAWDADVVADDTVGNKSLKIQVTGEAAKNIRWVARIELGAEVTG